MKRSPKKPTHIAIRCADGNILRLPLPMTRRAFAQYMRREAAAEAARAAKVVIEYLQALPSQ